MKERTASYCSLHDGRKEAGKVRRKLLGCHGQAEGGQDVPSVLDQLLRRFAVGIVRIVVVLFSLPFFRLLHHLALSLFFSDTHNVQLPAVEFSMEKRN